MLENVGRSLKSYVQLIANEENNIKRTHSSHSVFKFL